MPSLGKFWNKTQMDAGLSIAPYDRGGEILSAPGITKAQYPENSPSLGWINSYMSPIADAIQGISPYFGTSIYSSPGGLIDEILYYTRGFDTILESSILMMAFIIASWLAINFTMDRKFPSQAMWKMRWRKAIGRLENARQGGSADGS